MAKEYKWIVSSMDTAPSEDGLVDVVKTVHWRRNIEETDGDKTYISDIYGALNCVAPDPIAFKPYADLTFEDVCSWLENNIDVEKLDLLLDVQVENQKNPPIVNLPLPWVVITEPEIIPLPSPYESGISQQSSL